MGPRIPGTNHPLHRREKKALALRDELVKKYQAQGLSHKDALDRAQKEMRDNNKGDWRRG
jgi:hypothetical protein